MNGTGRHITTLSFCNSDHPPSHLRSLGLKELPFPKREKQTISPDPQFVWASYVVTERGMGRQEKENSDGAQGVTSSSWENVTWVLASKINFQSSVL